MTEEAEQAGQNADSYVLLTVVLAASLFFAGVTSSFRFPVVRLLLLTGSLACVGLGRGTAWWTCRSRRPPRSCSHASEAGRTA